MQEIEQRRSSCRGASRNPYRQGYRSFKRSGQDSKRLEKWSLSLRDWKAAINQFMMLLQDKSLIFMIHVQYVIGY
ncbi:hypothetical protein ABXJ76_13205 [Methylobacter sp. G7]|uniref:hypothetical protein n=1 Tax=Methylobacter sp. G7 TaxID=3230117 RepID=UPI003D806F13